MIIELDGISIEVVKKPIKNINLRIYPPDGAVKVSAPLRYNEQLIRHTLEQKKIWIQEQRQRMRNRPPIANPFLESGALIPFLGKDYLLQAQEHHGPRQIEIKGQTLYLYMPYHSTPDEKIGFLDSWYQQQMQLLLPNLISHWQKIVGVRVQAWGIRKMKTRWGSCNTRAARICMNLQLIKKPQICLEYVLVHELTHLLEPSHNARFYALMSQFMPQWREYQHLLEGN